MASPRRVLTPETLSEKGIKFHMSHLRRMWNRGEFPKPFNLTARRLGWDEDVIDAWIESRIAASNK